MTASRQHTLVRSLIETKKRKHGRFPRIKDAVKLFDKVDKNVWNYIDLKFESAVLWCEKRDLL